MELLDGPTERLASGQLDSHRVRRLALGSDVAALALTLALVVGLGALLGRGPLSGVELLLFVASIPIWLVFGLLLSAYQLPGRALGWSFADDLSSVFFVTSVWAWFWLIGRAVVEAGPVPVLPSVAVWAVAILLVPSGRAVLRAWLRRSGRNRQSVFVIGSPAGVGSVLPRIARQPDWGLDCVGSIRIEPGGPGTPEPSEVVSMVRDCGATRVVVAGWPADLVERTALLRDLLETGADVDLVASDPELLGRSSFLDQLEGLPILALSPRRLSRATIRVKRVIDTAAAAVMLAVLSPLLAYIAVRIKLDSPGPIVFKQQRIGLGGAHFEVFKFRTMVEGAEQRKGEVSSLNMNPENQMFKAVDDPRVTKYGARIRRHSLDELPQLWNVLRGEMSLVGPRPLPVDEAVQVPDRYQARYDTRPGLTGPWQVLGRSDIPFEDMVKLDYMYVNSWSPRGDLKLLLQTVGVVLRPHGAY